jgi:hypothetical protein
MNDKKVIAHSHEMKGSVLDDDYTLYEDGTVRHVYDAHTYPGGQGLEEILHGRDLSDIIKKRLLEKASEKNRSLVKKLLYIQE